MGVCGAALARECLHTHVCVSHLSVCVFVCVFIVCAIFVCHQVQNELSQTTEKLHGEVAQRQQLSEEIEQVEAIVHVPFFFFLNS